MDFLAKPVALVGGAGFLGLHVGRELKQHGASVRIVDEMCHGEASRIEAAKIGEVRHADVRGYTKAIEVLNGCGLVINLATLCVRRSLGSPVFAAEYIGALGSVVPFAAAKVGARRYVYVSSSEIYGEAIAGPLHEESLPRPQTAYGAAKLAGEHYATVARLTHGIEAVIVRPFNVYGPGCHIEGMAGEAIPRFVAQAHRGGPIRLHGDGLQTRDFTYVVDAARGIVGAALSDAVVNTGPVNLASGVERTIVSIAREIATRFGVGVECGAPRPCDLRRQVGCATRAQAILGWSPTVAWSDGLQRTVDDVLGRLHGAEMIPEKTWT